MSAAIDIHQSRVASGKAQPEDHRTTIRFKAEYELSYSVRVAEGSVSGHGRTVDVSSGGVLFSAGRDLPLDGEIHLSIAWPVTLDDGVPLQLFVVGRIVRSRDGCTAIKTLRYQFRTAHRKTDVEVVPRWFWGRHLRSNASTNGAA